MNAVLHVSKTIAIGMATAIGACIAVALIIGGFVGTGIVVSQVAEAASPFASAVLAIVGTMALIGALIGLVWGTMDITTGKRKA